MQNSKIQWTDHTFNGWIGCTKVSPGCANCYAETLDRNRYSKTLDGGTKVSPVSHWGPGSPRHRTSAENWKQPLRWNSEALKNRVCLVCGATTDSGVNADGFCEQCELEADPIRPRVFCSSLADWLDEEVPIDWLVDLLDLIRRTPNLDWLLLTKRPENWNARIEAALDFIEAKPDWHASPLEKLRDWLADWNIQLKIPKNIWIGATAENQEMAAKRIPELLNIPAEVRFLSCEPLLGEITFGTYHLTSTPCFACASEDKLGEPRGTQSHPINCGWRKSNGTGLGGIDWVICGGESGKDARPMHPDWARNLRDQCHAANVPFFFKQWGEWCPATESHGFSGSVMPDSGKMPCGKLASWIGWDGTLSCPSANGLINPVMAIARAGKHTTGRLLDGVEHNEFPEVAR